MKEMKDFADQLMAQPRLPKDLVDPPAPPSKAANGIGQSGPNSTLAVRAGSAVPRHAQALANERDRSASANGGPPSRPSSAHSSSHTTKQPPHIPPKPTAMKQETRPLSPLPPPEDPPKKPRGRPTKHPSKLANPLSSPHRSAEKPRGRQPKSNSTGEGASPANAINVDLD